MARRTGGLPRSNAPSVGAPYRSALSSPAVWSRVKVKVIACEPWANGTADGWASKASELQEKIRRIGGKTIHNMPVASHASAAITKDKALDIYLLIKAVYEW